MADIKTDQDHTKSLKDLTKENKKHKPTLEEQRATTEAAIDISKERRKTIEGLITVSDDLKVVEKDNLTAKKAVVDQVKGAGMSIVQGAEGFVTGMFGGPIGGIINTLSVGFLTRWLTNRKQESETAKDLAKKKEKEKELLDKRIAAMAKSALGAEFDAELFAEGNEAQKKLVEEKEAEVREQFEKREETAKVDTEALETKKAQAFIAGKSAEEIETIGAEGNGGTVTPVVDGEDEGEERGEVTASEGMSLDTTNQILTDIEGHLQFMTDNMEDAESRRERLRKLGAKKAGGKVDIKKEDDDGFSFTGLMGTVIGAISGALMGAVAGLSIGFLNMWKMIFKFIGGKLAKMFPDVTKMLSNTFGKGGHISKFFTSIKAFFSESKVFKSISESFKSFKTTMTSWGTKISKFFKPILKIFSGGSGGAKGIFSFVKSFKVFFSAFSKFFAKLFWPLQVIISLVDGFFEASDAIDKSEGFLASFFNSIVGFFGGILDGLVFGMLDLIKDGISWIAGFLGFEDVEKFLDSFSFSDMFNEFLDDIYAWFNLLFSDPVAALTNLFAGYFGAVLSVGDFIVDMLKKPFVWIMELFGWDDAAAATESFSLSGTVMEAWDKVVAWVKGLFAWGKTAGATEEGGWSLLTFVDSVWTKVKEWFTGIFSWASTEKEGDSWIVKTIKTVVKTVQDWLGSMFKFDSTSDALASVLNIMMWIPNLFVKAVTGITSYFAGLLGFDEASKDIADAGKEFSFGGLIMKGLKKLGDWLGGMFDIDMAALGRSVLGDTLYGFLFGDTADAQIMAKKKEIEMHKKELKEGDTRTAFGSSRKGEIEDLEKEIAKLEEEKAKETESKTIGIVTSNQARGAIVTKPAYLPASGTVVGEHASWSGKGAARGAVDGPIPDGGAEAVIPLDGERGGRILAEALAPAIAGAILNELMMARVGGGAEGGSAPTVIQDNSTNQNVTNNTIVRTPSPSGPGLHFEGRDFVHKIA